MDDIDIDIYVKKLKKGCFFARNVFEYLLKIVYWTELFSFHDLIKEVNTQNVIKIFKSKHNL